MHSNLTYIILFSVLFCLGMFFVWHYLYANAMAENHDSTTVVNVAADSTQSLHPFIEDYNQHPNALLIDIRTPEEYSSGHIPGAVNIDFYDPLFIQSIQAVAGDKTLFIYCRSGSRSNNALRQLVNTNIDVRELRGGILSYQGALAKP